MFLKETKIPISNLIVYMYIPCQREIEKKIMLLKEVPHVYKYNIYASISFKTNRSFLTNLWADIG